MFVSSPRALVCVASRTLYDHRYTAGSSESEVLRATSLGLARLGPYPSIAE
jgi:hypothetical protein